MISAIIQFIVYFSVVFVGLTHAFFLIYLIKTKNTQYKNIKPLHFLKAMSMEILAILLHIIFFPLANLNLKVKIGPGKNTYPILLIPGFMENQTDWWFHKMILQRHGLSKIYTMNLKSIFASIETHTQIVHEEIQRIKQETNQSKVILIGHSRGGLIASNYTECFKQNADVAMVITIATPFFGSTLAKYAVVKNSRQMLPDSDFLAELNNRLQSSTVPYRSIASTVDSLVFPWTSCIPKIKTKSQFAAYIVNDIGHNALLKHFKISTQLCDWLKSAS